MKIINNYDDYKNLEGKMIGSSSWYMIDQDQIKKFADVTLDHQWIHTDEERSKSESPFGSTIAHGYLTLSLIPFLWKQIADVRNTALEINYGIENFRFGQAVAVNSEVCLEATVKTVNNLKGTVKATVYARLIIKGQQKAAYSGDVIFLYQFK